MKRRFAVTYPTVMIPAFGVPSSILLHFLSLRADPHAQYEIRAYAAAMLDTVQRWVPLAHGAFVQHRLEAVTLSAAAWAAVRRMLGGETVTVENSGLGKREWRELMAALGRD